MRQDLIDAIVDMREDDALRQAEAMLQSGQSPVEVLTACRDAMNTIGKRFEAGEYFVPELILAGEMLKSISEKVKPYLTQHTEGQKLGRVLIGTVEGDIHDIGKDIVSFMLDVNGFEVRDLGVDVPVGKFVDAVHDFQPQVVALSGFLTMAYDPMKATVEAIRNTGANSIKIMIGGGQIDEQICKYTGADAFGRDAMTAVSLAKNWIGAA